MALSSRLVILAAGSLTIAALGAGACASGTPSNLGNGGGSQSSSSGTTSASSTSSASSATGSSSSSGTGGTGGQGSSTSSTSSSSSGQSTGSSTSSTSSSTSGAVAGTHILSVAESSAMVAYAYDESTMMAGNAIPWADFSNDPLGMAFTGSGACVTVARVQITTDGGTAGELRYAQWIGGWSPGFNGPLTPVQVTPPLYINGGPSLAGSSVRAHAAFQGTDMKFYYAEYMSSLWGPTSEPITAGGTQSAGPVPPAIAAFADTPVIAFVGNGGTLHDQVRSGGTWQAAGSHATGVASITPAIVAMNNGPELLIVYVDAGSQGLWWTMRAGGTWTAPASIAGTATAERVALAPLLAGGAVLSYQGTDTHLYTTVLSASAPFVWTTPVAGVMGSDPALVSPPAVATGATGAQAELLFLQSPNYILYSARMTAGVWGAPVMQGSASFYVAIATGH